MSYTNINALYIYIILLKHVDSFYKLLTKFLVLGKAAHV